MFSRLLAPTLVALAPVTAAAAMDTEDMQLAQMTIHERIVVRLQRMAPVTAPKPVQWRERKGPKCVVPADLAGVLVSRENDLDMVMYGGKWLRAKLDGQCRSLNFYSGVYMKPGSDGRVCAGRDVVRARSGGGCEITAFRTLETKR